MFTIPTAKGCQGCKDVISNELLHWFIQKSRFLLLQRLLLAVFLTFFLILYPVMLVCIIKHTYVTLGPPALGHRIFILSCHFLYLAHSVLSENFMIQQMPVAEIDPNIETLLSVLGKNSSCLTFTPKDFPFRFFRPIQWKANEGKNNLTIYILFEIS